MNPVFPLLVQVVLILINAFFASAEIAVISLNAPKLRRMAEDGDKTAGKLIKMVESPSAFLSTIQVGITLAGFLASAFAAESFSDPLVRWLLDDVGFTVFSENVLDKIVVIFITVILSYFMLIFGELVPKRIAMQKSYAVARFSSRILSSLSVVMKPMVWFLSFSTNLVLKVLHMKTETQEEDVTEEEIRLMVDIGQESGAIQADEKEMIENVFEFNNTLVREVMTPCVDVQGIPANATQGEILTVIEQSGLSRFPVYEENIDKIIGVLNTREYLLNLQSPAPQPLGALVREAYFVPEYIAIDKLFHDMQKGKIHFAVVVGEYGETVGICTLEDLLEELVGNIYDEFDPHEKPEIEPIGENCWRVSGDINLEDLSATIGVAFPPDLECDTLGGLVLTQLHSIPQDGAHFTVETNGLAIEVKEVIHRRITEAVVQRIAENLPKEKEIKQQEAHTHKKKEHE